MKARMSEKLRNLLSHPETARVLQKALVTPRRLDPPSRAKTPCSNPSRSDETACACVVGRWVFQLLKRAFPRKTRESINRQRAAQALRESLMRASLECRAESRRINEEFSQIEEDVENDW